MIGGMTKAEVMRELLVRWESSGKSLMAFGKQEGVPYSRLLYWRRKAVGSAAGIGQSPESAAPELVPINLVGDLEPAASSGPKFEVWLTNGFSLDVVPGFDEGELRRLVGVLQTC